jgi:carbonic anhydrase/acetyltransferase-like protein (isoleucine patch superfamily)
MKFALNGVAPRVHSSVWIADNATVLGNVDLAEDASVWFGAVIRGDNDLISIGRGSNVQEGCVLHTDRGLKLTVGEGVTIGHQAMVHGCTIGDATLIGIKAVVLNGAVIGRNCLIGANSLVTEGKTIPDGSLVMGSPAKVVRQLTPEEVLAVENSARFYVENARRHREGLTPVA